MHTYSPANSIFDGLVTDLLSVLCILIEVLSHARVKGKKGLHDFKFGIFTGCFLSDSTGTMAVQGLNALEISILQL